MSRTTEDQCVCTMVVFIAGNAGKVLWPCLRSHRCSSQTPNGCSRFHPKWLTIGSLQSSAASLQWCCSPSVVLHDPNHSKCFRHTHRMTKPHLRSGTNSWSSQQLRRGQAAPGCVSSFPNSGCHLEKLEEPSLQPNSCAKATQKNNKR